MIIPNPVYKKAVTLQCIILNMDLSPKGLIFIQAHEGFGKLVKDRAGKWHRVNPYNDSMGFATAGYGHLLHKSPVTPADIEKYKEITKDDALTLLKQDVQIKVAAINKLVTVPLTQYQFDAIVCFTFNVGEGSHAKGTGLAGSKFLEQLNKGKYNGMLMMHFHRPADIIGRRTDEINLFNTGAYSHDKTEK